MPQMAPLMWLYLFIFFIISLMLFISMNYFIILSNKNFMFPTIKSMEKTWKF